MKRFLIFGVGAIIFAAPAFAAPYTYAPETCEFQITFPEKPFIEKKCTAGEGKPCSEVVTYTQLIDGSSAKFRVTCRKEDPVKLKAYTPDDLKTELDAMVKEAKLEPFANDSAAVENDIKTSVMLAGGKRSGQDVIYTGQLWVGKSSFFTLEGEMIGPQNKKIDDVYMSILASMKSKSDTKTIAPAQPKP